MSRYRNNVLVTQNLLLQGSVGHQADIEDTDEPVNIALSVRHQSLVKLFLNAWRFIHHHNIDEDG